MVWERTEPFPQGGSAECGTGWDGGNKLYLKEKSEWLHKSISKLKSMEVY